MFSSAPSFAGPELQLDLQLDMITKNSAQNLSFFATIFNLLAAYFKPANHSMRKAVPKGDLTALSFSSLQNAGFSSPCCLLCSVSKDFQKIRKKQKTSQFFYLFSAELLA